MDRLYQYDQWLSKKSKKATSKPVYLRTNGRFKDEKEAARLVKYNKPTEYEIVFKKSYYQHNQNDPHKIKGVMSHELAHIKYPNTHDENFKKEAIRLGAGEYATARGKLKRR
jgi:predicted SprT family Zn-dependent metalloprotease